MHDLWQKRILFPLLPAREGRNILQKKHDSTRPGVREPLPFGSDTIAGMRASFVERRGKLGESDSSFDVRFWRAQTPKTRLDAAWQSVVHYARVKGLDVRQLRLERSIEALQPGGVRYPVIGGYAVIRYAQWTEG